jgi:hypothetical protein
MSTLHRTVTVRVDVERDLRLSDPEKHLLVYLDDPSTEKVIGRLDIPVTAFAELLIHREARGAVLILYTGAISKGKE